MFHALDIVMLTDALDILNFLTAWIISPQSVEMLQLLYTSALCSPTNSGTFEWVGDF